MGMIKRILVGLWVVSTCAQAFDVSPEQAMLAVGNWRNEGAQLNCRLGERPVSARRCQGANGSIYHVVRMEGGGFVVTSANTDVQPVIAFSSGEDFRDDDASPLRALLARDRRLQSAAKRGAAKGSSAASAKWERLLGADAGRHAAVAKGNGRSSVSDLRVAPLIKSQWSQASVRNYYGDTDLCYNYYTPGNYFCGCVATAGAQLMRHFQYPTAPIPSRTGLACGVLTNYIESGGWIYYSNSDFRKLTLNTFGGTYDWSSMPLRPAETEPTEAQRQAIGKLTYDIGVLCGSRYSEFGTSASGYYLGWLLKHVFGYANALPVVKGSGECISSSVLKRALIPNLENGLPVEVGLAELGTNNGHSVLIDGYGYSDGDLYVHVNMGWVGQNDAWYEPGDVDVDDYYYDIIDELVCNIYPTGDENLTLFSGRTMLLGESVPIANVTVVVTNQATMTQVGTTLSNEQGIYGFRLPAGSYLVTASYDSATASRSLTLEECRGTQVNGDATFYATPAAIVANQYDIDLSLDLSGYYATVHFDANGGSWSGSDLSVPKGSAVGSLPVPSRTGYWFDGWFTAAAGGTQVNAETVMDDNCTLYAHWSMPAVGDAGVWTVDVESAKLGAAANHGMILVLRANYAGCGYSQALQPLLESSEFLNWAHENQVYLVTADGSRLPAGATDCSNAASYFSDLYFSLGLSGTIYFPSIAVAMGTDVEQAVAVGVFRAGRTVGDQTYNGTVESLIACLSTYLPAGGGGIPDPPIPETCSVAFDANGGTVAETARVVAKDTALGSLPTPTRAGYAFEGWYTAATGGVQVDAGMVVSANSVLYAHWSAVAPETCKLYFNANGGAVPESSRTVEKNVAVGTLPIPTRAGYTFAGWYTAATGGTQVSAATTITSDRTVYARWSWNNLAGSDALYPDGDDADFTATAASTYNGWVYGDDGIMGTVTFKAGKASRSGESKVTVTYTPLSTGRKVTYRIVVPAGGQPQLNLGADLGVVRFAGNSVVGEKVQAGVDRTKSKDRSVKTAATSRLQRHAKVWNFAFETSAGYAAFSVTIDKKGKGKLAGTLPDGTKVSLSVQGALGSGELVIPYVYAKKGRMGFVFRVKDAGGAEVRQFSGIRLASGSDLGGTPLPPAPAVDSALANGGHVLHVDGVGLTKDFTVAGKKWVFAKDENAVKLTYTPKTGAVKGSFKGENRIRFNVTGEVVDGVFYGTAVNKAMGSFKVKAE